MAMLHLTEALALVAVGATFAGSGQAQQITSKQNIIQRLVSSCLDWGPSP